MATPKRRPQNSHGIPTGSGRSGSGRSGSSKHGGSDSDRGKRRSDSRPARAGSSKYGGSDSDRGKRRSDSRPARAGSSKYGGSDSDRGKRRSDSRPARAGSSKYGGSDSDRGKRRSDSRPARAGSSKYGGSDSDRGKRRSDSRPASAGSSKYGGSDSDRGKRRSDSRPASDNRGGRTSGGAPRKYRNNEYPKNDESLDPIPGNQEWGGLARKGVLRVYHDDQRDLEKEDEAVYQPDPEEIEKQEERTREKAERDQRQEELRAEAKVALDRAKVASPTKKTKSKSPLKRKAITKGSRTRGDLLPRFKKVFGQERAAKNVKLFRSAVRAYEDERFEEARRRLRPLAKPTQRIPEVHELFGLIMYRLGKYEEASNALEQFRSIGASTDQHPVLMDCYRAQERWADIDFLWNELREISPSGSLIVEGRIVAAGALADRGDLNAAVKLLEKGWKPPKKPFVHHLRRAYALADLYDRAGNIPRAREMFAWVVNFEPDFVDSKYRLKSLR